MRKRDRKIKAKGFSPDRNWYAKEVRELGVTKTKAFRNQKKYKRLSKKEIMEGRYDDLS